MPLTNPSAASVDPSVINALRHDPTAQFDAWKASAALARAKKKPMRVLLIGTSIASFDNSGPRIAAAQLQATYGTNKTRVQQMGVLGGTYNAWNGIKKQPYGGQPPMRAAFDVGVSNSWSANVDGFNVVYGTEANAGSFEVRIDDVLVATINCNGAQSYGNVWRNTFSRTSYHKLTLTAVGTGYAPIERVELRDDGPGVFVENATMGGVGLYHVIDLFTDSNAATNRAGVPVVGNNGIDSVFNRNEFITPDIIIQEHYTNDGLSAYDKVKQIMDRAVITTLAKRTLYVVLTESPALSFVTAAGVLSAERELMRALLMSYNDRENVIGIDWTKLVDFSDRTAYEARYFPGDDKTHPTTEAYLPLHNVFADLFEMAHPGVANITDVLGQAGPDEQLGLNPFSPDPYSLVALPPGTGRKDTTAFGGVMQAFARAENILDDSVYANVFLSDKAINSVPASYLDAIDNSVLADRYGPFVRSGNAGELNIGEVRTVQSAALNDVFTVLILARSTNVAGRGEIRLFSDGTGKFASFMLNAANPGGTLASFTADLVAPRYYYASFRRNVAGADTGYQIKARYLDVYGVWAVEGSVPVVTSRNLDRARMLGIPGYMTGDYAWDKASVGQTYLVNIPGKTIPMQKKALDALVHKWGLTTTPKRARLYEVVNRADHPVLLMLPSALSGTAALVYDEAVGVENYAAANSVTGSPPGLTVTLTAAVNGEQWTFAMRNSAAYDNAYFRLSDGSGGNAIFLQPDGTWGAKTQYSSGDEGSAYPANVAITFNMPTGAQATALGATPMVRLEYWGPNEHASPGTLVRGPSACI